MYKCRICDTVSRPGQSRLLHVVHRQVEDRITGAPRLEVSREIPVCAKCCHRLQSQPLDRVVREVGVKVEAVPLPTPIIQPTPVFVGRKFQTLKGAK